MKVAGISGSARKDGNTAIAVRHVFLELEKEGMGTLKVLGENMAYLLKQLCK